MEFQVKKDLLAKAEHLLDDGGAFGGVEFHTDFVEIDTVFELVNEVECLCAGYNIEGDNDGVVGQRTQRGVSFLATTWPMRVAGVESSS